MIIKIEDSLAYVSPRNKEKMADSISILFVTTDDGIICRNIYGVSICDILSSESSIVIYIYILIQSRFH
jgi:hypothetical protein